MKKFIVFDYKGEPELTKWEYEIGEVILVNSSEKYKCMEKKIIDGSLIQYFKRGIPTYNYDY